MPWVVFRKVSKVKIRKEKLAADREGLEYQAEELGVAQALGRNTVFTQGRGFPGTV